ncbi:MAG: branched-chain amino acid ABC transporter permease [Oscillospiraceae bacterium]|nr:branched-chain amino acid ABC transporter permease [Oscillospiraceae bacterium]
MAYFTNIKNSFKLKNYINYIGVTLFLVITASMLYTGNLNRSTANLITQIAYSIILAVSLNLVVGFLGELSLGHAGFMCVGAYIGCFVALKLHSVISSPLAVLIITMLIGGLVAAVFGFIIGLPALRLKGDYLAIVTLAFGEIVRTIFKNLDTFGGALGLSTKKYGTSLFIPALIVVIIMLILVQNLIRSKHGRAITAIRDNEIAARAMGINVAFYKLFVFVISAFFAGIAGVIYGHYATPVLYSFFSYNYSIEILVMVVLGGMGSINGSILAAVLITFINFQLTTKLSGDLAALKFLIYAIVLITIVIFNNAPALQPFKERFSLKGLIAKISGKIKSIFVKTKDIDKERAKIKDDAAEWKRIPTKIDMDALLSVDVKHEKTENQPDEKEDK